MLMLRTLDGEIKANEKQTATPHAYANSAECHYSKHPSWKNSINMEATTWEQLQFLFIIYTKAYISFILQVGILHLQDQAIA